MNIKELIKLVEKYDDAYYNGCAEVSDDVYDATKKELLSKLPDNHPIKIKVGHEVKSAWKKVPHEQFMGSQNKVCTEEGIKKWVLSIYSKLNKSDIKFVAQYKIDGLSLGCYYTKGTIRDIITRGDGHIGESITRNGIMFKGLVHTLPIEKDVTVRGEGVLTKDKFYILQKNSLDKYKNARNAASGISRRFDGVYSHFLDFVAFDVNAKVQDEAEKINTLKKLGFITVPTFVCSSIDQILALYRKVRDVDRESLPYNIDGLVLKVANLKDQDFLGVDRERPNHQIALKFKAEGAITEIVSIIVQVGRTGKLTPIAVLAPIDLDGSTVSKASLHNFDYISKNNIGVGASVLISKKGDIIPQVEEVVSVGNPYEKLSFCPSCGGTLIDDGVNIWCRNKVCRERDVNRIVYWIQTLDMKGFSAKFVEKLWDLGKLRSVGDIYKIKVDDFIAVDGIGEKTVKSFFATLESTSEMMLEKFIVALGIESCSKSTADVLVERYGSWDKIASVRPADLQLLPGFAETSSTTICKGIAEVSDMATELLRAIRIKEKKQGPLTGMSFCVTGSLGSMGRKEFYDMVVDKGGVSKNSVAEGLTYLVSNDTDSGSSKNTKAKKLGVKVINEEEFFQLLGEKPVEKERDKKEETSKPDLKIISENLF